MSTVHELKDGYPATPLDEEKGNHADILPVAVVDGDSEAWRTMFTYKDGERLKRKADMRIMVLLSLCYLMKNIDANVVSYVATINTGEPTSIYKMLNMTKNQYSYVSTCFTVTFILAEIPSNLLIKWATPRLHFTRILILWSITCACTAACTNVASLYACRLLLGLFEGGLWPGICYMLTCWYRPDEMAVRATLLITFSGIIDAVLTFGLSYASGHGMAGWQWAFVITGLMGLILAAAVFFFLPDWPDSPPSRRQFLSPDEAKFMVARLPPNAAKSSDETFDWAQVRKDIRNPLTWSFGFIYMLGGAGTTGLTFWLPTIIASWGVTNRQTTNLLTIPNAVIYIITSVCFGLYLDRQTRIPKPLFMLVAQVISIGLFIGMIFCHSNGGRYALIILAYMCYAVEQTCIIPMRAMTTQGSTSSAFAFAFNNVMGNSVGLWSAQVFRSKYAPRYAVPFAVCCTFVAASMGAISSMWYYSRDMEVQTRVVLKERQIAAKDNKVAMAEVRDVRDD